MLIKRIYCNSPKSGITEIGEPLRYRRFKPFCFAWLDNPLPFAPLQVQVDAAKSYRVGLCSVPVHTVEEITGLVAGSRPIAQAQQTITMQPCVQVNAALKTVHAVIA